MMAAYRLRGLGWFASCAGIVLSFYLVSLQVAQERNKLGTLNGRIRAAERDIRALETEFDTRANLQQLERWNGDILALSAPVASQFVTNGAQLASVRFDAPLMGGDGEVKTAALVVPALPAATFQPAVIPAATAGVGAPVTSHAVVVAARAEKKPTVTARVAQVARAAVAKTKPQKVAMLDRDLLSERTFGDIMSGARVEAGRAR